MAEVLLQQRVLLHVELPCLENREQLRDPGLVTLLLDLLFHGRHGPPEQVLHIYLLSIRVQILLYLPLFDLLLSVFFQGVESQRNVLPLLHLDEGLHNSIELLLGIDHLNCGIVPRYEHFVHLLGCPDAPQLLSNSIELPNVLSLVHVLDEYFE